MSLYKQANSESTEVLPAKGLYDKILFVFLVFITLTVLFNFYNLGDAVLNYQKLIIGYIIGVASLFLLIFSFIKRNSIYLLLLAILYGICTIHDLYVNFTSDKIPFHEAAIFWADPNRFLSFFHLLKIPFGEVRFLLILDFLPPTLIFTFFFFKERSKEKKLLSENSSF